MIKDTFKAAICASVPIISREESSRFSAVVFDAMMYAAERILEVGYPIIIEGNKELIDKYNYSALTFKFIGDTQVLHKRFIEREKSPERGEANTMFFEPSHNDFDTWCHNLDEFSVGGKTVIVDTTDFRDVNFESHIETARKFLCLP